MDPLARALAIGTPCIVALLIYIFPEFTPLILITASVLTFIMLRFGWRSVPEPARPIIYRFGQMHRLGPSGAFFLIPGIDEQFGEPIDVRPMSQDFTVMQIMSGDGESIYMNLELTWQLRPNIGHINASIRQTLLKSIDQRKAMIEHTVSVVARQLLLNYTSTNLNRADARESIIDVLRSAVNELLAPHGLMVETIFWRGSSQSDEYLKNRLAMKISHERVEATIKDIQVIRERLPDVDPTDFLAQQAWIDMMRRGLTPPNLTDHVPGLPYMPPQPQLQKKKKK
jgi:regulator of protease activity HflC (stomatin/prohibitin superfamily)